MYDRVLTPNSPSTQTRLDTYRDTFRRGETRAENWTYYPKGQAVTVMARCTGVRLDGHDEAMLVELPPPSCGSPPLTELRALEAVRHTPLMISLFAQSGEALMRNPAAERFFRELPAPLPDNNDHFSAMFACPDDCERLRADVAASGHGFRTAVMMVPGGPTHTVKVSAVSDPATGKPALLVTQNDISQTVIALRQLAASEEALEAVLSLNALPAMVLAADDGRVLNANLALDNIVGRGVKFNEKAEDLFDDKGAFHRLLDTVQTGGGGGQHLRMKAVRGASHWVYVSVAPIAFERRHAILVFITDVNWLYQIADSLLQELGSQREVAEMQRRVLAVASHDLRTPLAIIDSVAQRLKRHASILTSDEIIFRATRILESVNRMVGLLENTLERINDEVPALVCQPTMGQLADTMWSIVHGFNERRPCPSITMRLPALPEFPFDKALIEQALGNILDNAIKYSRDEARIDITAEVTDEFVQLFIRDHGVGIPEVEWGVIFSENKRGSNVGGIEGKGLGLSIVRQILELHGGQVNVVPSDGEGTKIRIKLPRVH
ncbi:MAG: HAMP domain-containing sensor histidine kinase [Formivibrio sp.]|nr:HAMP domain-containing sensor histidine kinase [Formivibrio sp.]